MFNSLSRRATTRAAGDTRGKLMLFPVRGGCTNLFGGNDLPRAFYLVVKLIARGPIHPLITAGRAICIYNLHLCIYYIIRYPQLAARSSPGKKYAKFVIFRAERSLTGAEGWQRVPSISPRTYLHKQNAVRRCLLPHRCERTSLSIIARLHFWR